MADKKTEEKIIERGIRVPPPVSSKRIHRGPGNAPDVAFHEFFVDGIVSRMPRKTKEDLDRIRELAPLTDSERATEGSVHWVTEASYQAVVTALDAMQLTGLLVLTYLPFIDAVVMASTERPKELEAPANGAIAEAS